jgi:ElaB/YqjD/DUF883 family membrane-anchored ribosome-binding protein
MGPRDSDLLCEKEHDMSRMNDPVEQSSGETAGALRDKASEVGQNIRDMGGHMRDAASSKYAQLRDQAGQYYSQGRETAQQWEQSLEDYIQEKPLKAVMIAAGAGLLLGLLWKRS